MGMTQLGDARTDQRAWALDQLSHGRAVPIFDEIPGDLDTPVSVFLKLRAAGPAFLLESVEGGEQLARYSFVGARPARSLSFRDGKAIFSEAGGEPQTQTYTDPLDLVAQMLDEANVAANPQLPDFKVAPWDIWPMTPRPASSSCRYRPRTPWVCPMGCSCCARSW